MNSELINALNRILIWLQQNKPDYVECLQPGLSKVEIDNLVQDLPFTIPQEIYELYQWQNGAKGEGMDIAALFGGWSFYPLERVILDYQSAQEKTKNLLFQKIPLIKMSQFNPYIDNFSPFLIFQHADEWRHEGSLWLNNNLGFCPVVFDYFDQGNLELTRMYTSLTSMMQTIAECYETGAYYINLELIHLGRFINHAPEKEEQIWLKYNSQLIEFALQALEQGTVTGWFFTYFTDILIKFKDSRTVKSLIEVLLSLDSSFSYEQIEDPMLFENPKVSIIKILGKIGDTRAVKVISQFTEDQDLLVRESAHEALSKLG